MTVAARIDVAPGETGEDVTIWLPEFAAEGKLNLAPLEAIRMQFPEPAQ